MSGGGPTRNRDLLLAVAAKIEAEPLRHTQGAWHLDLADPADRDALICYLHAEDRSDNVARVPACGSAGCAFGWAAELAGGVWHEARRVWLVPELDDPPEHVYARPGCAPHVYASDRARRVLGLTAEEAKALSDGDLPHDDTVTLLRSLADGEELRVPRMPPRA